MLLRIFQLLVFVAPFIAKAQAPRENYQVDSASVEQTGVPKGEILKFVFSNSKIFPGTIHEYWVYIPVQYKPERPACVYVNQDGIQWKAPIVFDNLIYRNEMPVTIGIFVLPGKIPAVNGAEALDRANRSAEYDGLGKYYVDFLLNELLPDVETRSSSDGRKIRLSKNSSDRAIGGSSSGAVCAFTAAWESEGSFSRVFSAIGTYVGLRGADRYPTLIRKYEPKPIRIFLQDGSNDLNNFGGDWWMANQTMERALTFSGYEVKHLWGEGGHTGTMGTSIFPEVMRWLWKGWPSPVTTGTSKNEYLKDILTPDQKWELGIDGYKYTESSSINKGIAGKHRVTAYNKNTYVTVPNGISNPGKIYLIRSTGEKQVVDIGLKFPNGIALTPDQTQLYVVESTTHWVWIFNILPNGTLANKQRYGWLFVPDSEDNAWAEGLTCDQDGRVYVATSMGVQVLDHTGRVSSILSIPSGRPSNCYFGGENWETFYVR